MDRFIARFDAERDKDLMLCRPHGVAYQQEMNARVSYDAAYFDKCRGYEGKDIANKINAGRAALVNKYMGSDTGVLDIGVGSGEFIKTRPNTYGFDINPFAVQWLKQAKRWSDSFCAFEGFTFWDVIEHVPEPEGYFRRIHDGAHLFASLPIFDDLGRIRESKHYSPGEHLYYWTEQGFIDWMAFHRFRLLERQDYETAAGRENIVSFAFRLDLPDYQQTLGQYREMHSKFYGSSAWLFMDVIAPVIIALNPGSILDYGCGRSDLVAHFWNDGQRRIAKYDAAISNYETMPEGAFDLVLCCDVMEHILMRDVEQIFAEIRRKSQKVLFTISLRPARARLPDGRNAHVTLLSANEWMRWIESAFGRAERVPTQWDHVLMVKTF